MLIAKHFDPVLGIDIHILITPAGPIPIPHPHIALILDPIDYIPVFNLGATVWVGGVPRADAGTAGMPIPHFPLGGSFVKPPMNENEIFMGSSTVVADGAPLSFTALPALSCHDIGMIAPIRMKKPKKSYGMVLPTSVLLAIPVGMPVMVGGPPTVDMMALAMRGGMSALGASFKKLRKMQKKSPRMKKISNAVHKRAKKAMDKLGVPANVRNKVHRSICTVTGHPVDVASGKMFTDHIDFSLPGPLPLVWERVWYSTSVYNGPLGHGWHHSYDVKLCEVDNAVAVRMADGRSIAFPSLKNGETSFDRQERMTLIRDVQGYALDTSEGLRYRFAPFNDNNEDQLLISLKQKSSGALIDFQYTAEGLLLQIIDSGGRFIRFTHTDEGQIHQILLPEPQSNITRDHITPQFFCAVEYHYRDGLLVQTEDALKQPLVYHYEHQLLVKETFRNNLSFYFEYDGIDHNARCVKTWGDGGIYGRNLHYDTANNITYVKDSLSQVTTYFHDGVLPHKVIDPLQHTTLTAYNDYAQVISETNELGYRSQYEYDDRGNTTKIIRADNVSLQFIYDDKENLVELIDAVGNSWRYQYDAFNRLAAKVNPLGHATRYEYSDAALSRVIDAGENQFHFHYDQNLNLRSIQEGNTEQILLEHDALGNLLASQDNRGNRRRLYYDKLGRVNKIEEPDGNVRLFAYDGEDNIIRAKDQQHDIFLEYRGMSQLVSRTQAGTSIKFEYDTEEQLAAIYNEHGRAYQFERNARGEIISESGFDGLMRQYIKDPAGRTTRINRAGQRYSTYHYDVNNQLTRVLHSDGSYKDFAYRADGELIKASNEVVSLQWELDPLGRICKEYQGEFWVSSEYDALGYRTNIQSSQGLNQRIARNQRGDVLRISTGEQQFEVDFKRDNQGLEIERSLPGGIHSRWSRDKLGRPIRHDITQGKQLHSSKTYLWGLNNRLLKLVDQFNRETVFQHDALGNLLSARYSDDSFDLRMPDAVGNLFKTQAQKDREYGPDGQLLAVHSTKGTTRYHYDAEGNLISKLEPGDKLWRYEWNGNGMLANVIRPDGKQVSFSYDPLGRRIRKTFNNKVTRWVWDGNNPLHEWVEHLTDKLNANQFASRQNIAEDIRADQRQQLLQALEPQAPPAFAEGSIDKPITWLFEPDSFTPMAKLVGNEHYSIIADHLGTPSAIFDKHGQQVWSSDIDVWGNLRQLRGERAFCPFRFPGQYEDSETGLYYNRFRYYDPEAGRYVSQDPIRVLGGISLYTYVKNPLASADPYGLRSCEAESLTQQRELTRLAQNARNDMVNDFDKLLSELTPGQIDAIVESPWRMQLFFGTALETRVARDVQALQSQTSSIFAGMQWTGRTNAPQDFINRNGVGFDITGNSMTSILSHQARNGVDIVVTYDSIPSNLGYDFVAWLG